MANGATLFESICSNFSDSPPDEVCTSCVCVPSAASAPSGGPFSSILHKAQVILGLSSGRLAVIADEVNPDKGRQNCGFIIDAVKSRLMGKDSKASAPVPRSSAGLELTDGSWSDIEVRFNSTFQDNVGFENAFKNVHDGGHGTMGLIKIIRPDGSAHVAMIANNHGSVAIIEGQGGGFISSSANAATKQYNADGNNSIGFAQLPEKFK